MQNYVPRHGVGVEIEGFIVNSHRAKERIAGLPASEWLVEKVRQIFPNLAENLSFEQASVMLEVKSSVYAVEEQAVDEILKIREVLDEILGSVGGRLVFQPVLREDFEFVASTSDPNSRAQQLIHEWGGDTPEGQKKLKSTVIAGFQVNDSRPYKDVIGYQEKLEKSRKIHNLYTSNFADLDSSNGRIRDYQGRTRMETLMFLIPEVKRERFARHGYDDPMKAALPGHFATVEEMQRWMMAHSGVDRFEDADCKNEHGVHVKTKRPKSGDGIWIAEGRIDDAVNSKAEMLHLARRNTQLLRQLEQ